MAIAAFGILVFCFGASTEPMVLREPASKMSAVNQVGIELLTTYAAPFELSGVLLLVCLIGAALTAFAFRKELK
jgi:NADH:ubiquinone oxidoreductase subunit 6 (subunit J)